MQVMLVEDNEMLAAAVVKALRTAGFSVNHISRGDQALAALKTSKPDILVLDLGLVEECTRRILWQPPSRRLVCTCIAGFLGISAK